VGSHLPVALAPKGAREVRAMKKALPLGEPEALLSQKSARESARQRFVEEAEQLDRELGDPFRWILGEWADGHWVRDIVAELADSRISEIERRDLREFRADFLSAFAVIAADTKIRRTTRSAVWEAILDALLIGCTIGSPELRAMLQKKFELARMATARKALAAKSAPKTEMKFTAVRAAMKATATKPTRGEAYARLIEPEVNKRMGLDGYHRLSVWTIRNIVRAIQKEAPRKSGKP
jgi:hypothetical protein